MLREHRRLEVPELDALHDAVEVRTPRIRIGVHSGRNVSSDFGVVERAAPFVHRMSRPCLTLLFEGRGRFDEGTRVAVTPGDLIVSDQRRGGTEAYAGPSARWLVMDWDPAIGAHHQGAASRFRPNAIDLARLSAAARDIGGPRSAEASVEIVRVLRANGLSFDRIEDELPRPAPAAEQELASSLSAQLSQLHRHPAIEDVIGELGWNARMVHRRMAAIAKRYSVPWEHWRAMLAHYRLVTALRLLAAPGATTELVARFTGFRSPSALCHAFESAGLPSPGVFVRAARAGAVLEGWADHAAPTERAA